MKKKTSKAGRKKLPGEYVMTQHLGLRFNAMEYGLVKSLVALEQRNSPMARVSISSLIKGIMFRKAEEAGLKLVREDNGKLVVYRDGKPYFNEKGPISPRT